MPVVSQSMLVDPPGAIPTTVNVVKVENGVACCLQAVWQHAASEEDKKCDTQQRGKAQDEVFTQARLHVAAHWPVPRILPGTFNTHENSHRFFSHIEFLQLCCIVSDVSAMSLGRIYAKSVPGPGPMSGSSPGVQEQAGT